MAEQLLSEIALKQADQWERVGTIKYHDYRLYADKSNLAGEILSMMGITKSTLYGYVKSGLR
jgi:hypothetical protein